MINRDAEEALFSLSNEHNAKTGILGTRESS